jgi:arginyl-tRNA synthetase
MINIILQQAESVIQDAIQGADFSHEEQISFDIFPEASDSSLATPVCFEIANQHGLNPQVVATEIVENVELDETFFERVVATGPYVNFYFDDEWYQNVLNEALEQSFGSNLVSNPKNMSVEHTSVNPTGPLHIGRVRNSIIGDCLCNILEFAGHDVSRDYYVNDAGLQVAMLVWGYNNFDEEELPEPENDADDSRLVRYYRKASEVLDKNTIKEIQHGNTGDSNEYDVIQILLGLEQGNDEIESMVDDVVSKMLNSQLNSLKNLGIEFNNFTYESEYLATQDLDNLMKSLKESNSSYKDNGAWKINLEDYDIDKSLVFERSNGTTLYGTRDILYHIEKTKEYDEGVLILGEDQEIQAKSVRAVVELMGYDSSKLPVVHHAFVQTPEGGMSTRQGEGDFLYEVISRTEEKALEAAEDNNVKKQENVVRDVAIGALRYNIVSKKRQQLATFDVNRAVSVQSQTGPSIQYAYARMNGIIEQTEKTQPSVDFGSIEESSAYELVEKLSAFPKVIRDSIEEMDPHSLAVYAKELKQSFNAFYRDCPVKNAESDETGSARMAIVLATYNVMDAVLELLGIPSIENM